MWQGHTTGIAAHSSSTSNEDFTTSLQTLFDIKSIPESTQLRTIIDGVDSDYFSSFFDDYTHYLQRGKHLAQYQLLDGLYYIPMDATDYI